MIFFLSSLPKATFDLVAIIFKMYSEGALKEQSVPRSKKGVKSFPDLKGSTFKPFRGIQSESVHQLMYELSEKQISLKEATVLCKDMKQLQRIQECFMKITNCESWSSAQERFPPFTIPEKLEPFKKLNFNTLTVPEQFMWFCKEALKSKENPTESEIVVQDHLFWVRNDMASGVLWKNDMLNINPDALQMIFSGTKHNFCGFQLCIFDLQYSGKVSKFM